MSYGDFKDYMLQFEDFSDDDLLDMWEGETLKFVKNNLL